VGLDRFSAAGVKAPDRKVLRSRVWIRRGLGHVGLSHRFGICHQDHIWRLLAVGRDDPSGGCAHLWGRIIRPILARSFVTGVDWAAALESVGFRPTDRGSYRQASFVSPICRACSWLVRDGDLVSRDTRNDRVSQQMHPVFVVSYVLLFAVVAFEALVLRESLRRVALLRVFSMDFDRDLKPARLAGGSKAPPFSVRFMGSDRRLTLSHIEGDETIMLFVSPREAASPGYRHLSTAAHAMWHQVEGRLYVVCSGNEGECQNFVHAAELTGNSILIDEAGEMAKSFLVTKTPRALRFDEEGRLTRYGTPMGSEPNPASLKTETAAATASDVI